jgi:general secretion pathway protein I
MAAARGFTLLEVLVALTIVALAMAALLRMSGLAAENSAELRLRMQAGWIAENRLAWLGTQSVPPPTGTMQQILDEDGMRWLWRQQVSRDTHEARLLRVEIRVAAPDAPDYPLAVLTGYLAARP